MERGAAKRPATEQIRSPRDEWGRAADHHPAAAGRAVAIGQRPGLGRVVEHRATHLAVEDNEVFDAAGEQFSADGSGPGDDDAVAVIDHRNFVRVQPRRAIGPNKPTSVRNSTSGEKNATWTSWRCGLVRTIRRA